jgi:hypothetical protein
MSQESHPPRVPDWELYRALREQWTHEDKLVNHRLMWLILSQGRTRHRGTWAAQASRSRARPQRPPVTSMIAPVV